MKWNKNIDIDLGSVFTIPNILTYFRIALIVPFIIFFAQDKYLPAAVCVVLSGLTDCFDGMIARKLGQVTQLGKMLDPLADKLTLIAVGVCLAFKRPMIIPVIIALGVKDILMLTGASVLLHNRITPCAAQRYGKIGTVCFYLSVAAIVVFDLVLQVENFKYVSLLLLSITTIIMIYSLIKYYLIFRSLMKKGKSGEELSAPDLCKGD